MTSVRASAAFSVLPVSPAFAQACSSELLFYVHAPCVPSEFSMEENKRCYSSWVRLTYFNMMIFNFICFPANGIILVIFSLGKLVGYLSNFLSTVTPWVHGTNVYLDDGKQCHTKQGQADTLSVSLLWPPFRKPIYPFMSLLMKVYDMAYPTLSYTC